MGRRYFITEVFAEGFYSGNQLATVLDCEGLDTAEMQSIARAFNFAETTFVMGGDQESGFDVRIFTPAAELPFAGHPTLGTAFLLRHHIAKFEAPATTLNLGVGPIPVQFADDGIIWMEQNQPEFGALVAAEKAAAMVGLETESIDQHFPARFVSTGLEFLLVPVKDQSSLRQARAVMGLSSDLNGAGILAFCPEGYLPEHQLASRMFAPDMGVTEDAATGSATGCLAAYLAEHQYLGGSTASATVGQGFEIGRPSALHLRSKKQDTEFEIQVGGRVNLVAEGIWHL